jgi:zinc/manganese transport system permease protein
VSDFVLFMAAPVAACVVLVGIHAYLGMHVVARGIIFVDLALAQISALGAAVGVIIGHELHGVGGYLVSLAFALTGGAIFALTRNRGREIPQEAIIGVTYAVAAAATLLVLDRAPHGAEHTKDLLLGSILWVSWDQVWKMAVVYGVLGGVLWRFHDRLELISRHPAVAREAGLSLRGWDMLFYSVFAVVVTSSVRIAGVLLVFSFLIVPTLFVLLVMPSGSGRLVVAWLFGIAVSVIGCVVSYTLDLPTGATVVCAFGLGLLASAGVRSLVRPGSVETISESPGKETLAEKTNPGNG